MMKIDGFDLNKDVLIIAEIGNNHEGSYALAEEMIGLASQSGAGAVKFQTIVPEKLVSVLEVERIQQLKKFQLSYNDFEKLSKVAAQEGLIFLSTPFDLDSVNMLEPLVPAYKIASGDNTFYPLIEAVAKSGKPIILSTGLSDMEQIQLTQTFIEDVWEMKNIDQELALLHCIVSYPANVHELNLMFIKELQKINDNVGFSDHSIGIDAAVLAVAMGARIIEKHFTIDKNYSDFHDHALSADPNELSVLVRRVKETLVMLGDGERSFIASEKEITAKVRRSLVACRDLKVDSRITIDDIIWVRPGGGIKPGDENKIIGKKLVKSIKRGEKILLENVV